MRKAKTFKQFKRSLRQRLAKSIGNNNFTQFAQPGENVDIKKILVCRPNHRLGNLLLITPLLQEITAKFPDCKIDLFVKGGLAPILFKNYENLNNIIQLPKKPLRTLFKYLTVWSKLKQQRYDLVLNIDKISSSGRIAAKLANSRFKFFGDENEQALLQYADHMHIAKQPVYNFRVDMQKLGYTKTTGPVPFINILLSETELSTSKNILHDLVKNDRKSIAIFTHATGAKCYSEAWWLDFYERLKQTFPQHNIVEVLPVENISKINFSAPSFYSKDVREICAFIANTVVFVGADSGIMHLASASQTPTVGLFSSSNPAVYAPYNNKSIALNTNETDAVACILAIKKILR